MVSKIYCLQKYSIENKKTAQKYEYKTIQAGKCANSKYTGSKMYHCLGRSVHPS